MRVGIIESRLFASGRSSVLPRVGFVVSSLDAALEKWFVETFNETYRQTFALLLRRARNRSDAEEALAMAYEVAWRRVEALQSAASPAAWLYGVAINCLLNVRRGNRRRSDLDRQVLAQPEIDPSNDPGVVVQFTDELERVEAILATMPERDREALRLTAYEGFTPSEVAEALGIRKRLVRSVLYRARRQLNARLESSVEWRDEDLPSTLRQAVDGDSDA